MSPGFGLETPNQPQDTNSFLHVVREIQQHFIPLLAGSNLSARFRVGGTRYSVKKITDPDVWKKVKENKEGKLLVEVINKDGMAIDVHVWIRNSMRELDDYPRFHLPSGIVTITEVRAIWKLDFVHFCVLAKRNGKVVYHWTDRYTSIPVDGLKLTHTHKSKNPDRAVSLYKGIFNRVDNPQQGIIHRLNELIEQRGRE
jgi:hypothetical protein